jgi:hypothetical protein
MAALLVIGAGLLLMTVEAVIVIVVCHLPGVATLEETVTK